MDRREFIGSAVLVAASSAWAESGRRSIHVCPRGDDLAAGTLHAPVKTIECALERARTLRAKRMQAVTIYIAEGRYELSETLKVSDEGSAAAPLRFQAEPGKQVVFSGGSALALKWLPYRNGIYQARVPAGTTTDQLFVNGQRQTLARYPNLDPTAHYLGGTAADALSPERVQRWSRPEGGYVNAMQNSLWGSLHYRITGKSADGSVALEGGWQVDRDQPRSKTLLFVEGIFEELDAPGEWFLDEAKNILYFYPPQDIDLSTARIEIVRLEQLVNIGGSAQKTARGVEFHGITFRNTLRTFMKTREQVLRSDWRIYRGGAVLLEDAEDIMFADCVFDQMGGNAVFVSGHNRRITLRGCHITKAGASGVCFFGRSEAVRIPLEGYEQTQSLATLDRTPGPRADLYPADCLVEDCLIEQTGRFEKQTAAVTIDASQRITVRHVSMYGVPRAGMNIGDGAWGGHRVEACDVFDTVLETSDHGAFNSWGRDRWWHLQGTDEDTLLSNPRTRDLPTLDAVEPNWLIGNRWACEHGWDIDLDDGSSNYRIENNLCLTGGIKLREGFLRTVRNNVAVNNTLHVHVWPAVSGDVVERNIVFVPYRPVRPRGWGAIFDYNFLHQPHSHGTRPALELQKLSGQDKHSLEGDALFRDLTTYALMPQSPARTLGIASLGAPLYGVMKPELRAMARQPDLARLRALSPSTLRSGRQLAPMQWMGATVRNLVGMGEMSEFGAPTETGVVIEKLPDGSAAARAGLLVRDLLLGVDEHNVKNTRELHALAGEWNAGQAVELHILRHQRPLKLTLVVPAALTLR
jgi:hypothetical protein